MTQNNQPTTEEFMIFSLNNKKGSSVCLTNMCKLPKSS